MRQTSPTTSPRPWLQIVTFFLLLGFMMAVYFLTPEMKDDQRDLAKFLFALLAGFATYFIGGKALLRAEAGSGGKQISLSATAGVATFLLLYLVPPWWENKARDTRTPPQSVVTPTPGSGTTASSTPSPGVAIPTPSPRVEAMPSPSPTSATVQPKPTPVSAQLLATLQTAQPSAQLPLQPPVTPRPPVVRNGRVLLLIEDETILQALLNKLTDYGLRAMSGREYGEAESAHIRQALPQLQAGNVAASASIPFAIVVTGNVTNVPQGEVQGTYLIKATVTLTAIVSASGEAFRGEAKASGSGQGRESAVHSALREVATDLPEIFFRQIAARAR